MTLHFFGEVEGVIFFENVKIETHLTLFTQVDGAAARMATHRELVWPTGAGGEGCLGLQRPGRIFGWRLR